MKKRKDEAEWWFGVTSCRKARVLTGFLTHVLDNSRVTFSGGNRELLILPLTICLNGEYSPSFHTFKAHWNVFFSFNLTLLPSSPCWRRSISTPFPPLPWPTHWPSSEITLSTLSKFWLLLHVMTFRRVICLVISEVLLISPPNVYTQAAFSHFHRWSMRLNVNISRMVFKYLCPCRQTKQGLCTVPWSYALLICWHPSRYASGPPPSQIAPRSTLGTSSNQHVDKSHTVLWRKLI